MYIGDFLTLIDFSWFKTATGNSKFPKNEIKSEKKVKVLVKIKNSIKYFKGNYTRKVF